MNSVVDVSSASDDCKLIKSVSASAGAEDESASNLPSPSSSLTSTSSTSSTSILINELNNDIILNVSLNNNDLETIDELDYNNINSNNNNNNYYYNSNKDITLISLPTEIIDKILHHLNQSTLSLLCLVCHDWNKIINALWHTIDLSKSHHHFTHLSTKIKHSIKSLKKSNDGNQAQIQPQQKKKISNLESIVNNLISNYGFLIPGLGSDKSPPIFQRHNRNLLKSKDAQRNISNQFDTRIEQFFVGMSARYQRIEVLDLSGCSDIRMDSLTLLVDRFSPTLIKLVTRRCKSDTITDDAFARVVRKATKLKCLCVGEMPHIGDLTLQAVCESNPHMESLGLGRCHKITDLSIIKMSNTTSINAKLRVLGLNHMAHLSDAAIRQLGTSCQNLVIFSVSNMKDISSDTMASIFMSCPHLGSIDIGGCEHTDDTTLEAISINCHKLFQLNISRCKKLTAHSINQVISRCKQLRILFLSRTSVDDDCLLNAIENLNLEVLYAIHCSNLSDRVVQSLFKLGNEKLSKMNINLTLCPNISQSLISILQHLTKSNPTSTSLDE